MSTNTKHRPVIGGFAAEDHLEEIGNYVQAWSGTRVYHVIDCFGFSQRIKMLGSNWWPDKLKYKTL